MSSFLKPRTSRVLPKVFYENKMETSTSFSDKFVTSTYGNIYDTIKNVNRNQLIISPSNLFNFSMNDPLIDYLEKMTGNSGFVKNSRNLDNISEKIKENPRDETYSFQNFIVQRGNVFEKEIIDKIKRKFNHDDEIFQDVNEIHELYRTSKVKITRDLLYRKTPIIYQGVLEDKKRIFMYGRPDLIVRGDYLEKFITNVSKNIPQSEDYYYIVDIKSKTLKLRANDNTIYSAGIFKYYKMQLFMYKLLLEETLNKIHYNDNNSVRHRPFSTNYAFILGKSWKISQKGEVTMKNDPFDRLGVMLITENEFQTIFSNIIDAIEWKNILHSEFGIMKLYPKPSHTQLYPNMKNTYDFKWRNFKNKYASEINEITMLWNCSVKHREYAMENYNIDNWKDNLTSEKLGLPENGKIGKNVDNIIEINTRPYQNSIEYDHSDMYIIDYIPSKIITKSVESFQKNIYAYFDFETILEYILIKPETNLSPPSKNLVFMNTIYLELGPEMNTHKLYTDLYNRIKKIKNTNNNMEIIFNKSNSKKIEEPGITISFYPKNNIDENLSISIIKYMKHITEALSEYYFYFYHWSPAEIGVIKENYREFSITRNKNYEFVDLCLELTNAKLAVKDAFGYSLKNISNAMIKHGMIKNISWDKNSKCADGTSAMMFAKIANDYVIKTGKPFKSCPDFEDVLYYNQVDTKILAEILNFFVSEHEKEMEEIPNAQEIDAMTLESLSSLSSWSFELHQKPNKPKKRKILEDTDDDSDSKNNFQRVTRSSCKKQKILHDYLYENVSDTDSEYLPDQEDKNKKSIIDLYIDYISKICNDEKYLSKIKNNFPTSEEIFNSDLKDIPKKEILEQMSLVYYYGDPQIIYESYNRIMEIWTDKENFGILNDDYKGEKNTSNSIDSIETIISKSDHIPQSEKQIIKYWYEKYQRIKESTQEKNILYNQIITALKLPYTKIKKISISPEKTHFDYIKNLRENLDNRLYGMENVKFRLLQYMNKYVSNKSVKNCLALCGPPGVGKTAIAQSISETLGLPMFKYSIGGEIDASVIRGSSGVWVGATEGIITKSLINMGVSNGVLVIDEIDKIGKCEKGMQVTNSLLEIIDPTQNSDFKDRFLEDLKIDLSKLLIIMTMNETSQVNSILLDRMEIIKCNAYTIEEKYIISKKYIIPRIMDDYDDLPNNYIYLEKDAFQNLSKNKSGIRYLSMLLRKIVDIFYLFYCCNITNPYSKKSMEVLGSEIKKIKLPSKIKKYNNKINSELITSLLENDKK